MKKLRLLAFLAILAVGFVFLVKHIGAQHEAKHIFGDLAGPHNQSTVPPMQPVRWQSYEDGSDSRVAILLTHQDSDWLGLAHGLKSAGIPFSITTDVAKAVHHKVVMVYPILSNAVVNTDGLKALDNFVRAGGTLIGFDVLSDNMKDDFGFGSVEPLKARYKLQFAHPAVDADPMEKEIPIDNPQGAQPLGVYAYNGAYDPPIAAYEDGKAAITEHHAGQGRAIAFGVDVGALMLRGYNNRQENMARSYDNGYEPALDVLTRLIGDIYRTGDDRAVTLGPVPDGKKIAVMLTHDIDYTRSLVNAIDYAKFEHDAGIRATYFMQTKYIRDYNDDVILNADSPKYLQQLRDLDMEIGSHTVSHSRIFNKFPMGEGTERYPTYHPFVEDRENTKDGTILGELRVSRFLIENLVPGYHVNSFRPGYLSNPYGLPQALVATGYRYSSSVTANDSLTHLPFQLTYSRENTGEVPIYEFPITIADGPPLLTDRLPEGIDLAKKIARYGGLCVILIHPDVIEPKLGFEKQFVAGVKDFSWFGTIEDYGRWWEARDTVSVDSHWQDGKLIVHLKTAQPIDGLSILLPNNMHALPDQKLVEQYDAHAVTLGMLQGEADLTLAH